jgi:hypothetical protein
MFAPVVEPRCPGIILIGCCNRCRHQTSHGSQFLWISLQICHLHKVLMIF